MIVFKATRVYHCMMESPPWRSKRSLTSAAWFWVFNPSAALRMDRRRASVALPGERLELEHVLLSLIGGQVTPALAANFADQSILV